MREKELRECATCAMCGNKIGHTGLPMFWRVKIERHGIDLNAVRRQSGLAMMIGPLASVMGPDEEMTTPLMDPVKFTVCEDCAVKSASVFELAAITENANDTLQEL